MGTPSPCGHALVETLDTKVSFSVGSTSCTWSHVIAGRTKGFGYTSTVTGQSEAPFWLLPDSHMHLFPLLISVFILSLESAITLSTTAFLGSVSPLGKSSNLRVVSGTPKTHMYRFTTSWCRSGSDPPAVLMPLPHRFQSGWSRASF